MVRALTLSEVINLKEMLGQKVPSIVLHMRDACGAQTFVLEQSDEAAPEALQQAFMCIDSYAADHGIALQKGSDGVSFWIKS